MGSRILLLQHIHSTINHKITRHAYNQQYPDRACSVWVFRILLKHSAESFCSIQNTQFCAPACRGSTCTRNITPSRAMARFQLHKKHYTVKISQPGEASRVLCVEAVAALDMDHKLLKLHKNRKPMSGLTTEDFGYRLCPSSPRAFLTILFLK